MKSACRLCPVRPERKGKYSTVYVGSGRQTLLGLVDAKHELHVYHDMMLSRCSDCDQSNAQSNRYLQRRQCGRLQYARSVLGQVEGAHIFHILSVVILSFVEAQASSAGGGTSNLTSVSRDKQSLANWSITYRRLRIDIDEYSLQVGLHVTIFTDSIDGCYNNPGEGVAM